MRTRELPTACCSRPDGPGRDAGRTTWYVMVAALTLLAAGLRLWGLGKQPLWEDEAQTYWIALRPLAEIPGALAHDCSPPLFYFVTHTAIKVLGASERAVRLPSALLGIAAVPLVAAVARGLGGSRWLAIAAGLLLATSPLHIWHSQEARMYALLVLLALASGWFMAAWARGRHWLPYVVTTALLLSTHHFALYLVAAEFLWLVLRTRPRKLRTATIALAVLYAPIAWLFWTQVVVNQTGGWIGRPSWDAIGRTFGLLSLGVHADDRLVVGGVPLLVVAGVVVFGPAFISGARWWIRRNPVVVWITLAVPVLAFGVSQFIPSYTTGRYDIVILPFYLLVVAGSMRSARRLFILAPLLLVVTGEPVAHHHLGYCKSASREVAEEVRATEGANDFVVIAPEIHYSPFKYYYAGSLPCLTLTGDAGDGIVDYAHYASRWEEGEVAPALSRVGRAYRGGRIYLVWSPYKGTLAFKARLLERFRLKKRSVYRTGSGYLELDVLEPRSPAAGGEAHGSRRGAP